MTAAPVFYQPKGGMCMTCKHSERDCSPLPFPVMPVISVYRRAAVVRCTEHVKPAPLVDGVCGERK